MTHIRSISYFKRCRPGGVCRAADDRAGSRIPRDMYVGMRHSRCGGKQKQKRQRSGVSAAGVPLSGGRLQSTSFVCRDERWLGTASSRVRRALSS